MAKECKVLVTGGAGYIGSHVVLALQERGYSVVILDNLSYGHRDLVESVLRVPLIVGDMQDRSLLQQLFTDQAPGAVMHFAAFTYVGESVQDPAKYYRNNVIGSLNLLDAAYTAGVEHFVFSSTCATYGLPQTLPIPEEHSQVPINPYGAGKLMVERAMLDYAAAYGLETVIFRYFNAAGADPAGRLGEDHNPETHLIPLVLLSALGKLPGVKIFGEDYPTPDGTCIRDYIHVADLAAAHILGLEYLLGGGKSTAFNLGNGQGFSVRQVIDTAAQVSGRIIPTSPAPRRPGDPPILVGSSAKAQSVLGWVPQYPQLEQILEHAWAWHQKRHG